MRITLPSGTAAEIAYPAGHGAGEPTEAGLVVVPDIGGLRVLFDELVARIADEQGWTVCAFDLWPGREDLSTLEERLAAAGSLEDERVIGDAIAAADATGAARVGLIGFCIGGMYALKAAGTGRFDRVASFYGMARVPDMWRSATQGEPLDALASTQRSPTLAIVGTADPWVPAGDVDALEAAGVEVVRYEGAEHGFVHDPDRPAHRPDDAADAWRRVIAHLRG